MPSQAETNLPELTDDEKQAAADEKSHRAYLLGFITCDDKSPNFDFERFQTVELAAFAFGRWSGSERQGPLGTDEFQAALDTVRTKNKAA